MELSPCTTLIAFILNFFACAAQHSLQSRQVLRMTLPLRHSEIMHTRQKFLHWQDYTVNTYGSCLGVGFMWEGFGSAWQTLSATDWIIFALLAIVCGFVHFLNGTAARHKPNWMYPSHNDEITPGGFANLVYFGLTMALISALMKMTIRGDLTDVPLILSLVGAIITALTFIYDRATGRFDKIKWVTPDPPATTRAESP